MIDLICNQNLTSPKSSIMNTSKQSSSKFTLGRKKGIKKNQKLNQSKTTANLTNVQESRDTAITFDSLNNSISRCLSPHAGV